MQKIEYCRTYFEPKSTLECGQTFRFYRWKEGYFVCSEYRACYLYAAGDHTVIECEDADSDYFFHYFDLERDYSSICGTARSYGIDAVNRAVTAGQGLRILNQNTEETVFSFIVSQNNHIPRIRGIIERLAASAGEEREFLGEKFYTFPSSAVLAQKDEEFFSALGAGYRAKYLVHTARALASGALNGTEDLRGDALRGRLSLLNGVGPKVADCVALFAYHDTEAFPVDTWIERVYREDFKGKLTDRRKISEYFRNLFGVCGGYIQQYLFYGKREERR